MGRDTFYSSAIQREFFHFGPLFWAVVFMGTIAAQLLKRFDEPHRLVFWELVGDPIYRATCNKILLIRYGLIVLYPYMWYPWVWQSHRLAIYKDIQ